MVAKKVTWPDLDLLQKTKVWSKDGLSLWNQNPGTTLWMWTLKGTEPLIGCLQKIKDDSISKHMYICHHLWISALEHGFSLSQSAGVGTCIWSENQRGELFDTFPNDLNKCCVKCMSGISGYISPSGMVLEFDCRTAPWHIFLLARPLTCSTEYNLIWLYTIS